MRSRSLRCALLSSFTLDALPPLVGDRLSGLGLKLDWYIAPFNQYAQEILNPSSGLFDHQPDVVFVAVDLQDMLPPLPETWTAQTGERVSLMEKRMDEYVGLLETLAERLPQTKLFVHNFPLSHVILHPLLECNVGGSWTELGWRCNLKLIDGLRRFQRIHLLDAGRLVAEVGLDQSVDPRYFYLAKMRLSGVALQRLSGLYSRVLRAYLGLRKKCIVTDLDNVLWGGVLGEEGIERILLSDDGPGKAFQDVQRVLLDYHHTGTLLALCSKNDPELALEAMRQHPQMLLRPEHFVSMRINWNDKVDNLVDIAQELGLGLDSFVFVDDSPFERERVQLGLPMVEVIDLPAEPCDLPGALAGLPYFDTLAITQEDASRSQMVRDDFKRDQGQRAARSVEEFLSSLNIKVRIKQADSFSLPRVAQLTQKTNQFNLTSKRYTEGEIGRFIDNGRWKIYCVDVEDRMGSSGMVGTAIIEVDPARHTARLDTFLLSCRVLGRGIESGFLAGIISDLGARSIDTLEAEFVSTKRNSVAKEFLASHGFVKKGQQWNLPFDAGRNLCPGWVETEVLDQNDAARAS